MWRSDWLVQGHGDNSLARGNTLEMIECAEMAQRHASDEHSERWDRSSCAADFFEHHADLKRTETTAAH